VQSRLVLAGATFAVLALSCRPSSSPAHSGLSVATQPPPSSLLRLPSRGGNALVYRVPSLLASEWRSEGKLPELRRAVGADLDQRVVYALDLKGTIILLDLESGKFRNFLPRVRSVTMGPDGTLYTVDDSSVVTQTQRRNPVRMRTRLPGALRALAGTKDDQLLTVTATARNNLLVLGGETPDTVASLPDGPVAASPWGDLLAVAADSGVVIVDPQSRAKPRFERVNGKAKLVVFSPSGHRLWIADGEDRIHVMNRYTGEEIDRVKLPGPASELRPDTWGRWLLIRPMEGDSAWLMDVSQNKLIGAVPTAWSFDAPTITNQGLILLKQGADLVVRDLTRDGWPSTGKIADGAADLWLPLAWTPESATEVAAVPDSSAPAASDSAGAAPTTVYLQVSSSQNPAWARDLAGQLRDAGLPASVLEPSAPEDGYRVVLGPYASRDEAEAAGRKLGRPFFIYQPGARAAQ